MLFKLAIPKQRSHFQIRQNAVWINYTIIVKVQLRPFDESLNMPS